jgi:hypothetical protein
MRKSPKNATLDQSFGWIGRKELFDTIFMISVRNLYDLLSPLATNRYDLDSKDPGL